MYKKAAKGWLKHLDFVIIELLSLQLGLIISILIRYGSLSDVYHSVVYKNLAVVSSFILIFVIAWTNTFSGVLKRGYEREIISTIKTVVYVMTLLVLYLFMVHQGGDFSRLVYAGMGLFYFCLATSFRCILKYYLRFRGVENENLNSLYIVTSHEMAKETLEGLRVSEGIGYKISGIILLDNVFGDDDEIDGVPIVAHKDDLERFLTKERVDEIFLNLPYGSPMRQQYKDKFVEMGITTHFCLEMVDGMDNRRTILENIGKYHAMTVTIGTFSNRQSIVKRSMDIMGAIFGCLMTGILFIFVAPAIYIASPGPIFFKQERIGKNGKKFKLYKFRSMCLEAEDMKKDLMEENERDDDFMFKMENDPRIIGNKKGNGKGIGNFIRKTSIDEFPQFFNVLKGDMSLVGTRPPTVEEWEKYENRHRSRMSIKPGVTGLWQVSGRDSITDFEEVVKLDVDYINTWSVGRDIIILLKTVKVMFDKKNAS